MDIVAYGNTAKNNRDDFKISRKIVKIFKSTVKTKIVTILNRHGGFFYLGPRH